MKVVNSLVDGFMVVLGSYIVHLAAALTILICFWWNGSVPEYEDNGDRSKHATIVFWILLLFHALMAFVKYAALEVEWGKWFWDKLPLFVFIVISMACYLAHHWIFNIDRPEASITEEQEKFETWLYVEYCFIWSYIVAGTVFAFVSQITRPKMRIMSVLINNDSFGDFMEQNSLLLDLSNTLFAPAIVGGSLALFKFKQTPAEMEENRDDDMYILSQSACVLCLTQVVLIYIGIFLTRGNEHYKVWCIRRLPQVAYYSNVGAGVVMPWMIILQNSQGLMLLDIGQSELVKPYMVFTIIVQALFFCRYLWQYNGLFNKDYDRYKESAKGYVVLRRRLKYYKALSRDVSKMSCWDKTTERLFYVLTCSCCCKDKLSRRRTELEPNDDDF